ncbi:MAG: hypothetical protein LW627_12060 [Ilumatobacteraceae bacterium]|nr:hypothetical protein [Ilumatobacteraceae bacterium]
MNVSELNRALPQRLRIDDAPNLVGALDDAAAAGWTSATLAAHLTRKCGEGAGTGAVIWQIRNLPAPPAGPQPLPRHQGHTVCTEHRTGCEICRCHPTQPTHHRTSSALEDGDLTRLAEAITAILLIDGRGPLTYTEPTDHPGRLPCLCPNPIDTMALVATGHPIEPGPCPLHTAWARTAH